MVIKLNCFDRADPADLVPVMADRVHLSSVAIESFAQTLDMLHPDA